MAGIPSIDTILLASTEPGRLREWYQLAFGVAANVDGFLEFGHVGVLIVPRDDVLPRTQEPGRVIINVTVADARAAAARLDSLGVSWVAELEYRKPDGLWFATALDPDGNYVQIIEVTEAYLTVRRDRERAAAV
jgi:Glyoxalase-like domain